MKQSCHTYEWVMTHICTRHGKRMNESCPTAGPSLDAPLEKHFGSALLHLWMNQSYHTYSRVMSNVWMGHACPPPAPSPDPQRPCNPPPMNKSCHTYRWVMLHLWMSQVTRLNAILRLWKSYVTRIDESCCTYEWVMSHIWMSHVTHMNESCHTHECVKSA